MGAEGLTRTRVEGLPRFRLEWWFFFLSQYFNASAHLCPKVHQQVQASLN